MKVYKLDVWDIKELVLFSSLEIAQKELLIYMDSEKYDNGETCPLTQTEPGIWTSPKYPDLKILEIEFP